MNHLVYLLILVSVWGTIQATQLAQFGSNQTQRPALDSAVDFYTQLDDDSDPQLESEVKTDDLPLPHRSERRVIRIIFPDQALTDLVMFILCLSQFLCCCILAYYLCQRRSRDNNYPPGPALIQRSRLITEVGKPVREPIRFRQIRAVPRF